MLLTILLVAFYIFTPFLILYACHRLSLLRRLGAILVAYGVGILAGASGLLPDNAAAIQDIIATITIPLALPLMLFSSNIKSWIKLAGNTIKSLVIALVAVVIAVVSGYVIFNTPETGNLWKTGGLLIGVYSGGTPNLAALKLMLDVDNNSYILTHAYDMIISAAYFFFLIIAGQKVFGLVLPRFRSTNTSASEIEFNDMDKNPMWGLFKKQNTLPMLTGLGLSVAIFALGGSTTLFVPENSQMMVVMLVITTLGILFSLWGKVNKLKNTFELGMYLILIFSIDVASMVDITEINGISSTLFYYVFYVIFGSLLLHVLLSAVFKIDTDTVIVTSTALICSPPFVPAVAGSLKNREIIVPGLTVGIIGYAVGNYLGVIVAELLRYL